MSNSAWESLLPNTKSFWAFWWIENGHPQKNIFPWAVSKNLLQTTNKYYQLVMDSHCSHSRTDLLDFGSSSNNAYISEFPCQAKVSYVHYSAKQRLFLWLWYQDHNHSLVQTRPRHRQEHKSNPERSASLHAIRQLHSVLLCSPVHGCEMQKVKTFDLKRSEKYT